jgi:hypothetical protein
MTRRSLLLAALVPLARADSADEVWDVVAALASALSEANAAEFLHPFDPSMPAYQKLRDVLAADVRDFEISATVDLVSNDGNDRERTLVASWELEFAPRAAAASVIRRETQITLKLRKDGRRWRIFSLDPPTAFDPPAVR